MRLGFEGDEDEFNGTHSMRRASMLTEGNLWKCNGSENCTLAAAVNARAEPHGDETSVNSEMRWDNF